MDRMQKIVEREGGPKAVSLKLGCPRRTAESWASESASCRRPHGWLVKILDFYLIKKGWKE